MRDSTERFIPALGADWLTPLYDAVAWLVRERTFKRRLVEAARIAPGHDVLDLGCGTGTDALALAEAGRRVHGLDLSPEMIARARSRATGDAAARLSFEVRAAEEVGELAGPFDGAYSDFGALNCAEPGAVGAGLARVLRGGAPVVLSLIGRWPLPALAERALTGQGPSRRDAARVAGIELPVRYPGRAGLRAAFGPGFAWSGGFALGVLVPGPAHAAWASRHPQLFGALVALEGRVRGWPLLRALGDHVVLEGRRR